MKFKLPFLLLLSLMWQAAASADEWTNIATAVTVTEGRLCAGELAADGTGTDILCDVDHPVIDGSGNVTVSGELSATILNATQLCDEDGANCTDLSNGIGGTTEQTCTENQYCEGTVISCNAWAPDGSATVTSPPNTILYGSWSNTQCGTSGTGWYTTLSSCSSGSGTTYARCDSVVVRTPVITSLISLTDVSATAPTDGQLLSYDASENEWVATNVISKTIIYNSIDDDPCVVTAGVRKLSFNPSTGRLRVCRP